MPLPLGCRRKPREGRAYRLAAQVQAPVIVVRVGIMVDAVSEGATTQEPEHNLGGYVESDAAILLPLSNSV